jgi:DNA-binding transcriptional ArsR family regulator
MKKSHPKVEILLRAFGRLFIHNLFHKPVHLLKTARLGVGLTFIHRPNASPMAKNRTERTTVFLALSDPTRRTVVEQLRLGPASVGALAAPHDMALPSFLEHLRKLEAAGLITSRKGGPGAHLHSGIRRASAGARLGAVAA